MLIDTHCHLDATEFDIDRDQVIEQAEAGGVKKIIVPSITIDNLTKVKACADQYLACYPAYGIHPLFVSPAHENDLKTLHEFIKIELNKTTPPIAIGEIGLDFFIDKPDVSKQEYFFSEQLKIANEFDLPVLLHVRRAIDPVLKLLKRHGVKKGIAHAFNGSFQQAELFIKQGFKLGFGGSMTYSRATRIRELAKQLPLESMVLETDAPDIPPIWLNKQRNSPAELPKIAEVLAEIRQNETKETINRISTENCNAIFIWTNKTYSADI